MLSCPSPPLLVCGLFVRVPPNGWRDVANSGEVVVRRSSLGSLPDDEHPFNEDLHADFSNPLLG